MGVVTKGQNASWCKRKMQRTGSDGCVGQGEMDTEDKGRWRHMTPEASS